MKKIILFIYSMLLYMIVVADTIIQQVKDTVQPVISNPDYLRFKEYLLGKDMDYLTYTMLGIFLSAGLFVKWYLKSRKSVKNDSNTPNIFSWRYYVSNNLWRKITAIFANLVIAFIALRFSNELFNIPVVSMATAFGFGIGFDYILDRIAKWQKNLLTAEQAKSIIAQCAYANDISKCPCAKPVGFTVPDSNTEQAG